MNFNKYFLGILPGFLICLVFIILDKNRNKNFYKYVLLLLFGALSSYFDHRIENKVGSYFPEMVDMNWIMVFIYAVFGVAIFEEGAKWFFTLLFGFSSIGSSEILSFSVVCSMGFAIFENVVYYLSSGDLFVAISRMFITVPSHACNAIVMGHYLIKMGIQVKNRILNLILSIVVPVFLHALYNALLYKNILLYKKINLLFYILLLFVCIRIVVQNVRSDKNDKKFYRTGIS